MIEQGLIALISTGIATVYPGLTGGFPLELPENFISTANPWSWCWRSIISTPLYLINGQEPLTVWEVQLDCHGKSMANAIGVARAIDGVLRGSYAGTLPDSDATVVQSILRLPSQVDGFNTSSRTYVRSLEYSVTYVQI